MKKMLFVFAVFFGLSASARDAYYTTYQPLRPTEIQVFVNYRRANSYDQKIVSTWKNPLTADILYVPHNGVPTNAACFMGDPDDARALFDEMVAIFNYENRRSITSWSEVYYDPRTRAPALVIFQRDEAGQVSTWFERMRQCVRWSTPEERRN